MKSLKKALSLLGTVLLLGSFVMTGCNHNAGNKSEPETSDPTAAAGYELTFEGEEDLSVSVDIGGTATLTVATIKGGKWIIDEASLSDEITVDKTEVSAAGDVITITGVTETTGANISFIPEDEDSDEEVDITVIVNDPYYHLTLNLDEDLAAKAASIEVTYKDGDGDDAHSYTATVEYTANAATAAVKMAKSTANDWGYFNHIVITVIDSDGNSIATNSDQKSWVCYYTTNEEYYSEATITENTYAEMTLSFALSGFTLSSTDKVAVTYGITASSNTKTADATIAADGKSATLVVGNDYLNDTGWFEVSVAITKDDAEYTTFKADGNGWYEFTADSTTTITLTYQAAVTWKTLAEVKDATSSTSLTQILTADKFTGLTITGIKVATSGASTVWWANCSYNNDDNEETTVQKKLDWDTNYINGYSVTITDADYIANIAANGLYLAGGYTAYYVYYY